MSASRSRQGRGGGVSSVSRTQEASDALLQQSDSREHIGAAPAPPNIPECADRHFGNPQQRQQIEAILLRHSKHGARLRHSPAPLHAAAAPSTPAAATVASTSHSAVASFVGDTAADRPRSTRGRGGRVMVSPRSAMADGCAATRLQGARFDAADASPMCVFLAATLSWLPVLVALDHPDDDHLHAVCAADDSASAGDAAAAFLVPRPLIFRHDGQLLQLRVGEHAQMLLSHELGYECDVWTKVVIKKVWAEGYAVVTMCSECRDVVAPKHRLRSDSMQPMHHDMSFSSLVSHVAPSVRASSFRSPCCRGRHLCTSTRALGRIGDIAPDTFDMSYIKETLDDEQDEPHIAEQGSDVSIDVDVHSLEIDIEIVDGSVGEVLQDVSQRVSSCLTIHCIKQTGSFFRLALHGSIRDVECATSLLQLHSRKIKDLEEIFNEISSKKHR